MPHLELPQVTDEHRREAFAINARKWPGVTFDEAMRVDVRKKIIEACAHVIRTRQAREARDRWNADLLLGPRPFQRTTALPAAFDGKRAAAHDIDD